VCGDGQQNNLVGGLSSHAVPTAKSNPHVLMVQSTKDRPRVDTPGVLNEPSNRRILV